MKERNGHYYDVIAYKDSHGLVIRHNTRFDDVVDEINDIIKRSRAQGYRMNKDEKWIILSVEWGRVYDDEGVFVSSWEKRTAVALYDNGTVTDL